MGFEIYSVKTDLDYLQLCVSRLSKCLLQHGFPREVYLESGHHTQSFLTPQDLAEGRPPPHTILTVNEG